MTIRFSFFDFFCYIDWQKPTEKFNFARGDYDAARDMFKKNNLTLSTSVEDDWEALKMPFLLLETNMFPVLGLVNEHGKVNIPLIRRYLSS